MSKKFDCVIPAAGTSSRMSTWKLLLPFNGSTIIEHVIDSAQKVCNNIIVVTGYRSEQLKQHLSHRDNITFVDNPDYRKGMFSSLQVGIRQVKTDHFFISHGDLPLIPPSVYSKLTENRDERVVFPTYRSKRGHPVLLPKSIIEVVIKHNINSSMKELLQDYPTQLIPVETDSIYRDIDTDEDYMNLLKLFAYHSQTANN